MTSCEHKNLVLIKKPGKKLRCRHCHLTINRDELESDFCPECYENSGTRFNDFDEVMEKESSSDSYRCEKCGTLVTAG